jgi:O-antigen/teichoic acid export membrane protein
VNLSQKVAFNTVLLTGGRLAVAASGVVGVIVSTRYLGLEAFGELITAVVFVTLFGLVTDVGIWTVSAREIAKRPDEEERILSVVCTIGLLLSAMAVTLTLATMLVIYPGSDGEMVRLAILILSVQMLSTSVGGASAAYMTAHQRAVPAAVAAAASSVMFVACLVAVVVLDIGFAGVAASYALGGLANALIPFAFAARSTRIRFGWDRALAEQMVRWALPQGAVLAVGVLYFRIDTVLLSLLGSDADVALYGVAYRVIEVLIVVPAYAMLTLFPELSRCEPHSDRLNMLMQGAFSSLALAAVPLLVGLVAFAPEVVLVAGGEEFRDAAPVLQLLVVAVLASYMSTPYIHSLVALNQQGRLARMLVVVLTFNVVLNCALIPPLEAVGAAIALILSEGVVLVSAARLFGDVGARPRLQRPGRLALAGLATAAVLIGLRVLNPVAGTPAVTLVIAGTLTLIVYGAAVKVLDAAPTEVTSVFAQLRARRGAATN